MPIQYLHNSKGEPTGVFVPLEEWEQLSSQLEQAIAASPQKAKSLEELKQAFRELKSIEEGTLKSRPANALLNEL